MVVNILDRMMNLGFSKYEALAYISLLKEHPSTAYEVAKTAGIPTSKIYEVINKLIERTMVIELIENTKKKYIPKEPDEFIEDYRNNINDNLDELKTGIKNLKIDSNISYIWNIYNYIDLINKAREIILSAKKEILISTWNDEISKLNDELTLKKKLKIAIVNFGNPQINIGQVFAHPIEDTIYQEKGGRGLVVIKDSCEALIGTIFNENNVEGACSKNKGFVALAEDYIKHDIYIMKIVSRFNDLLLKKFGKNYHRLRDIFNDYTEE